jgi:DNA-binding response OmpR family regulator
VIHRALAIVRIARCHATGKHAPPSATAPLRWNSGAHVGHLTTAQPRRSRPPRWTPPRMRGMISDICVAEPSMSETNRAHSDRPRLLVVEDDVEIVGILRRYFSGQGFEVSTAADGAEMRAALESHPVEIVLLDLGLPGEDGFALTRYLREHWKVALIIVTGRGEPIDRVVGLELGADDYVTKPFDLRELLARVRSVLRRTAETAALPATGAREEHVVRFAGFRLDLGSRELTDARDNAVALTTGEFELLSIFVAHPNRVLSRDDLMSRIHGRDAGPFDRAIDVQIGRLRRKVESDPAQPTLIKSVRGAGYLFATRVERG